MEENLEAWIQAPAWELTWEKVWCFEAHQLQYVGAGRVLIANHKTFGQSNPDCNDFACCVNCVCGDLVLNGWFGAWLAVVRHDQHGSVQNFPW